MKRIMRVLLLLILVFPLSVKADMGAPTVAPYEVVPESVEGAPYYDSIYDYESDTTTYVEVGRIPYESKVRVTFEWEDNGVTYGSFEMQESYYYINLDDFLKIDTAYKVDTEGWYDSKVNYDAVVLVEDGLVMRKGPSIAYNTTGYTIPFGSEFKVTYEHGEESTSWVYATFNGKSGWVSILEAKVGFEPTNGEHIYFYKNVNIYDSLDDDATKLGTIKAFDKVYDFKYLDDWSFGYYVEYNGLKGYVSEDSLIYDYDEEIEFQFEKEVSIREQPNKGAKVLGKISAYDTVKAMKFVETDAEPYWWYYVEYNGVSGWVPEEHLVYGEDPNNEPVENPEGPAIDPNRTTTTTKKVEKKNEVKSEKSFSLTEVVVLCVGTAFIVAATGIVTILLVNKKKSKKVEVKEEVKEEVNNTDNNN